MRRVVDLRHCHSYRANSMDWRPNACLPCRIVQVWTRPIYPFIQIHVLIRICLSLALMVKKNNVHKPTNLRGLHTFSRVPIARLILRWSLCPKMGLHCTKLLFIRKIISCLTNIILQLKQLSIFTENGCKINKKILTGTKKNIAWASFLTYIIQNWENLWYRTGCSCGVFFIRIEQQQ